MKKTLITGGAGLIGFNLITYLLAETDDQLVVVDNFSRGRKDREFEELIATDRVTFHNADLCDQESFKKFGSGYDYIYHLAAVNGTDNFYKKPAEVLRINTLATLYLLEWMRETRSKAKLLFTATCESYAGGLEAFNQLPIPTPENVSLVVSDPMNERWSYAGSKIVNELFVINYARAYGFQTLVIRPHNFYGPRDFGEHVIPDFMERVKNKVDPFLIRGADNTRSFLFITDGVRAMRGLMKHEQTEPVEIVNIGSNEEITMQELAEILFKAVGWKPKKLEITNAPKGSTKRRQGDSSKLMSMIDWKPLVSIEQGLRQTYQWYAAYSQK